MPKSRLSPESRKTTHHANSSCPTSVPADSACKAAEPYLALCLLLHVVDLRATRIVYPQPPSVCAVRDTCTTQKAMQLAARAPGFSCFRVRAVARDVLGHVGISAEGSCRAPTDLTDTKYWLIAN